MTDPIDPAKLLSDLKDRALDVALEGFTIADARLPARPLIYVNHGFEILTGYTAAEVLGRNCRFLQGEDRDQDEIDKIREALRDRQHVTVTLRNYRKNGELFYNNFSIRPLFDRKGRLLYFLGVQYDVTNQVEAEQELARLNELLGQT